MTDEERRRIEETRDYIVDQLRKPVAVTKEGVIHQLNRAASSVGFEVLDIEWPLAPGEVTITKIKVQGEAHFIHLDAEAPNGD